MDRIEHLYLHVPFCSSKCDYCAFHSIPSPAKNNIRNYFQNLETEISEKKDLTGTLKSIYIGGGTPSILETKQLKKLFTIITDNFSIANEAEITIECNPDSLNPEKIEIISSFANRISIGIQTFNNKYRNILGRKGSISNLDTIIDLFIENGISNLSCDLIYAIPGQTVIDFKNDLQELIKYPLKHISLYSLTFEEGTTLTDKLNFTEKDFEENSAAMWYFADKFLSDKNIKRYEVSNYAEKGFECKHNLNTWFGGKLLGLGPTASSFDGSTRWTNPKFTNLLKNNKPEIDKISETERFIEIFSLGLRTSFPWLLIHNKENILIKSLYSSYKTTIRIEFYNSFLGYLNNLKEEGFIKIHEATNNNSEAIKIKTTKKGMLFWDSIALTLMNIIS